jgi:FlaA1/EpsC-like NDP-sugar epimerase
MRTEPARTLLLYHLTTGAQPNSRGNMSEYPVYPDLNGKTAFVTGGSGGIGAETCRWLAANRVRVAVSGRNVETLGRVVEDLKHFDVKTISIAVDCTDSHAIERAACNGGEVGSC